MQVRFWRYLMVPVLLVNAIMPSSSWAAPNTIELSMAGKIVQAELALTEKERAMGLMHRKEICENCGMLFVFPSADKWAFWSKNTPLALSVAFVDGNGCIVQIVDMEPNSIETHAAEYQVAYALEMARGWFAKNSITTGDNIDGLSRIKPENTHPVPPRKECT